MTWHLLEDAGFPPVALGAGMEGDGDQVMVDEIAGLRGGELPTSGVEVGKFLAVVDDGLGDLVDQRRVGLLVREQRRVRAGNDEISILPALSGSIVQMPSQA